ncbi:MAG: MCE family protein [Deltaproteobacteria bacterium]|jgi:phospholipid/cholesterol/gamma-HCH transport system substrate-binding protein|nr:MCE family protein [Deltaproteobacteria bacterium]
MASQKVKFTVGLFVFSGIVIGVLAFIWLGMSRFLEKGQYFAVYFDESVQGLDISSPVKYRGVEIGRVVKIEVAPDSKLIQVIVKIEKVHDLETDIAARLSVVGITGSMFIELDLRASEEPDRTPLLDFEAEYPVLASKPSNISEILEGIDDFLKQIRAIDIDGISGKIKITLDNFNRLMADANIKGLSEKLESLLEDFSTVVDKKRWKNILASAENATKAIEIIADKADRSVDRLGNTLEILEKIAAGNENNITEAISDFRAAMAKANTLFDTGNSVVTGMDDTIYQLGHDLNEIARNIEEATDNLNRIIDIVSDQPSQLLFGEPPAKRNTEE